MHLNASRKTVRIIGIDFLDDILDGIRMMFAKYVLRLTNIGVLKVCVENMSWNMFGNSIKNVIQNVI